MGCDIHIWSEYYDKTDGTWKLADPLSPNEYYDPSDSDDPGQEFTVSYDDRIYTGRNYDLFAILADVRNGRGFAGIKTGEGFIPIDDPRGLPDDVSEFVQFESDRWSDDAHSHSYLTLDELLNYDWDQQTTQYGTVDPMGYAVYLLNGKPFSWRSSVSGPNVKNVSNAEMGLHLSGLLGESGVTLAEFAERGKNSFYMPGNSHYTTVSWSESYRDAVGTGFFEAIKKLQNIAVERADGNPEHVRIVFFFDN